MNLLPCLRVSYKVPLRGHYTGSFKGVYKGPESGCLSVGALIVRIAFRV